MGSRRRFQPHNRISTKTADSMPGLISLYPPNRTMKMPHAFYCLLLAPCQHNSIAPADSARLTINPRPACCQVSDNTVVTCRATTAVQLKKKWKDMPLSGYICFKRESPALSTCSARSQILIQPRCALYTPINYTRTRPQLHELFSHNFAKFQQLKTKHNERSYCKSEDAA